MVKYVHYTLTMLLTGVAVAWELRLPWQGYLLWSTIMAVVGVLFSFLHYVMVQGQYEFLNEWERYPLLYTTSDPCLRDHVQYHTTKRFVFDQDCYWC